MKQLTIAVDIDDTITNTFDYLIPYIAKFYQIDENYLRENNISYTTLTKEMKEKELEFAWEYYEKVVLDTPIKEDATQYLTKIKKLGHKIIIVTARNNLMYSDPYKITEAYLKKHNVPYDELICSFDKVSTCKENKVDILVDDSISHCKAVSKEQIKPLLFASKSNISNEEFTKVYSWQDVYHYIANHS